MNRLQIAALVTNLVHQLKEKGSWCGETHLQKSVYIAQQLANIPLGFDFILYKHGPFSFDFRDELSSLRADGLLKLETQTMPYGPKYKETKVARELQAKFPKTLSKYKNKIEFLANSLGNKQVDQLERLSTALFAIANFPDFGKQKRANWMNKIKPHVSIEQAAESLDEIEQLKAELQQVD